MNNMNNSANQAPAKKSKIKWVVLAAILLLLAAIVTACSFLFPMGGAAGDNWLASQLENGKVTTIELEGDYYLDGPVEIHGEKIIEGEGRIFFAGEAEEALKWKNYQIPEEECFLLNIPELEKRTAMFTMAKGSSLTIGGKVSVNALGKVMAVKVSDGTTLTVRDEAVITGGLGANIINYGTVSVEGGTVLTDNHFGIMNHADLYVTGGALETTAKNMACVVSDGEVAVSGGAMKAKNSTNIYVTDGNLTVTGGNLETSAFDNIYIVKGTAEISGGTISGAHGVHNAGGNVNVTGGQWTGSNYAIYNEAEMTLTGVTIEKTLNHAVVNRGETANMVAKNLTIGTATVHGIYNIRGAHMEAENLVIENAMGRGVHNGGAFFTGKNVTIERTTLDAGVGNEREKGWAQDGTLTIDGLTVKKAASKNIVCTGGEVRVTNATLGGIRSNSVQVSGGTVYLKDVEISGTIGTGALHGIYLTGGVVNAENVTIGSTAGRGIQNRGALFNGKNIVIKDPRATGIGNTISTDNTKNGTITIDGLEISGGSGYSIHNVDDGTIEIKNGTVIIAKNTGLRMDKGTVKLTNFNMIGEGDKVVFNGFNVTGGNMELKDVTVKNMTGSAIRNTGGTVTGSNVTIFNNGATAIYNDGGTVRLTNGSTSGTKGYNVDAKAGTMELTNFTFGVNPVTSINVNTGSNLILNNVVVSGTTTAHAVYVRQNAKLTFTNLSIRNAGSRALSNGNSSSKVNGGTIVGTGLTISNPNGTAIGNDFGTMTLKNVKVTDCDVNTVNVKSGSVTIDGAELCKTANTNVSLSGGDLNLKNVTILGTAKDNGISTSAGKLTINNVTIKNVVGRGINNSGATITGTGLTITKAGATAIYNEGTMDIKNVSVSEGTGYNIDAVKGSLKITGGELAVTPVANVHVAEGAAAELVNVQVLGSATSQGVNVDTGAGEVKLANTAITNANLTIRGGTVEVDGLTISDITVNGKHGIDMTGGDVTLNDVTITKLSGGDTRGIYQSAGTLTFTGTATISELSGIGFQPNGGTAYINGTVTITDTNNSINVGNKSATGMLHIGAKGKLVSNVGIYLPKDGYLTMDADTIGNTAQEPLKIRPDNMRGGAILVKAGSAEAANNALGCVKLLSESLVTKVDGTNIVVANIQKVSVGDWAALEAAVKGASAGNQLTIVLTNDITQPADGVAIGANNGQDVVITDNGNGYTITRNSDKELFVTGYTGTLTFDGSLTIVNNSSGSVLANNGNMTLNNITIDCSAAYSTINMNGDKAEQTGGHNLTLNNVTAINATLYIGGGTVAAEDITICDISTDSKHGINMVGGEVTLNDVTIANISGTSAMGIYQKAGTLTFTGSTNISKCKVIGFQPDGGTAYINGTVNITDTPNSINVSKNSAAGLVHFGANGKLVSNVGVYLPKDGYLTMDADTIGNTAEEPLKIRPDNMSKDAVLVKTGSAEAANNILSRVKILSESLTTKVDGTDIVVSNLNRVSVGDWAALEAAVKGASAGNQLTIVVTQNITQPAGAAAVGTNNGQDVIITDNGKGYTITRNSTKELFVTGYTGTLTLDGSLTIVNKSTSGNVLANNGNMTLNNITIDCSAAYSTIGMNGNNAGQTGGHNMTLNGVSVTNATLYIGGGAVTAENVTISDITTDGKHGINMTGGEATLNNVTIANISGTSAMGIYQSAGTLTFTGTTNISNCKAIGFQPNGGTAYINSTVNIADTPNSVNVAANSAAGKVHIGANGKLVSNVGVYLPKDGYLTMDADTIGNTTEEPLKIRANNMSNSSVLVKAGSAEAAENALSCVKLLSEELSTKVDGTNIVVTNQGANQQTVSVGDWAALEAAAKNATAGNQLTIVVTQNITQPADGAAIVPNNGIDIVITDNGKGYTITRNSTKQLFLTGYTGTLTINGLTIINKNGSGNVLENNGNMTLNNVAVDCSAAYSTISMNGNNAGQTGGHDLILNNVTLTNANLTLKGGEVEVTGVTISGITTNGKHGINMTGGVAALNNVTITNLSGADTRGIYQSAGTLTFTGTTNINGSSGIGFQPNGGTAYINGTIIITDTSNSINVGNSSAAGKVHFGANGKFVSNVGIYLPSGGYLTMDAATIGNTAEEPLKIRANNMSNGSVLVKAGSAEAANNILSCVKLLSDTLFTTVNGTNVIVTNQQLINNIALEETADEVAVAAEESAKNGNDVIT